ncbi:MAG: PmbA/TldA family metallopeptidase, partial [Vulcanimicrobiaceae bacterium]
MDKHQREAVVRALLARSGADQTEALVRTRDAALTRFAHGVSHQNVASVERSVSVRAIVRGRTGVAATNDLCESALGDVVERAIALAKLSPADPTTPILPAGAPTQAPQGSFVAATAQTIAADRARLCKTVFDTSEQAGFWCSGYVLTA